jgi:hypothetical protein
VRFLLRDDPTRQLIHDELEAQCYQYLTLLGWLVVRTHDGKHHPRELGVTDLIAPAKGSLLLEIKRGRDKLRPDQIAFADRAIRCGLEVHEIRSLDEVIAIATARNGER